MGGEMRLNDSDVRGHDDGDGDGDGNVNDRVLEWEVGLPGVDDLTPLSQCLVPAALASAFSIAPLPHRSVIDVNRASQKTLSNIRGLSVKQPSEKFNVFKSFGEYKGDETVIEGDETVDLTGDGSDSRKLRRVDSGGGGVTGGVWEEADSAIRADDSSNRASKRPRLVWTPQLHKRFVDVVAHLGVKNAVPKTIMQLMNVEGLTRENVASHLQKYRLYLKRMQGLTNEGPSSSDHLFASTPVPQSLHESSGGGNGNNHTPIPFPMPLPPQMMPHMMGHHPGGGVYNNGLQSHSHSYNMTEQSCWPGNKFVPYQNHMNNKLT